MNTQKAMGRYIMAVIALGAICLAVAVLRLPFARFDIYLLLLSAFTIGFGSRLTIQIPRIKSHFAVSDTFIFLTLLMYGGEFAVILAAVEAIFSSWRFCNKKITVVFNAATMAISTSLVVFALNVCGLNTEAILHGTPDNRANFVIALSVIALTQFVTNTSLAATYASLKGSLHFLETWKNKYLWVFFSYFTGAVGAALLIQMADTVGVGIIFATFPIVFFVFLTYRMYMKTIEISIRQAEQAKEHAEILESKSDALRESEERFRSAFDYAPIGIGLVSPIGKWLKVNHALIDILGYSEEEFLSTDFQSITLDEDLGPTLVKIHELLAGKLPTCQMEQRYVHKTGATVWTLWSGSASNDAKSEQPNLIFQIQDITEKKAAEIKLKHEATHDTLTGLPNRAFFMGRLSAALEKVQEINGYRVSVLFIDLDRFKYVNDSLGHLIGDELLKEIAVRLRDCMRPSDVVARLGGDEFTILVEGKYDTREVTRIADRIQHKFGIPFDLLGHEVYSSASIGILHASDTHLTSEDVMRDADTAMYQAKRAGKARHEIFDEKMHSAAKEVLRLETDLRRAVEREEIQVYYQPIYSLKTGTIECFESLARWDHPELGQVPPSKFIPLAEEIGLIDRLCEQVLRRACRDIGSLQNRATDEHNFSVSVNLSCRQFSQSSLVQNIETILDESRFSPANLKLEITESVFFEHQDRAVVMLNQLRDSGIEINIDDFGTGYSNLGYLKKLPVSALKIDRSFVSMIDSKGNNDEIVRAIITLARNLGLTVIAEGVETEIQLETLKKLDCEGGQGYLFARPMCFEDLCEFLANEIASTIPPNMFPDIESVPLIQ
jgi:diguanylate cyclase (GGDEF)-like protein/PAS domain S-box-containing protein